MSTLEVGYGPVGQAIRENPELAKNITQEQHAQILSTVDDFIEDTKKEQERYVNKANQDNDRAETRRAEQDKQIRSNSQTLKSAYKDKTLVILLSPQVQSHDDGDL
ncbi:MAG: hypothetical protein SGARI_007610 [Bacillariaceae sp.]